MNSKNDADSFFELKTVLKKFKKDQLIRNVLRMPCFHIDAIDDNVKLSKDQIAEMLLRTVLDKDLEDVIARLRLVYIQMHSYTRLWKVAEIMQLKDTGHSIQDPLTFEERLQSFLNKSHFSCKVSCQLLDQGFWTEIKFERIERKSISALTYLLYYPHTSFFLYCGLKTRHHKVLERALLQTLQGIKIRNLALNGRSIESLLQLALQRDGQDFSSASRIPSIIPKQLKKQTNVKELEQFPIVSEHQEESQIQEDYVAEVFGSYELPRLEVITYTTKAPFFGFEEEKDAICRVKFKGQSVLEGFQELVHHGFTCVPLPSYVTNVPYFAINTINIVEGKKQSGNDFL